MAMKYMVTTRTHSARSGQRRLSVLWTRFPLLKAPLRFIALFLAFSLGGCTTSTPPTAELEKAEQLFVAMHYEEAVPLVKDYLLHVPDDPSAHWLLGACYRNTRPSWLTVAEGEFHTALELFAASGKRGALSRFHDDTSFQLAIHRGRALTGMQWMLVAMDKGMRPRYIHELAEQALTHVERARAIAPGDEDFKQMEATLRASLLEHQPGPGNGPDARPLSI